MEKPGVYVATYDSEFGPQTRLYASPEGAEKWRQEIADEWFEAEWPDLEKPSDPVEMADAYFEAFESFTCEWQEIGE